MMTRTGRSPGSPRISPIAGLLGAVRHAGLFGAVGHAGFFGAVGHAGFFGAVGHAGFFGAVGHALRRWGVLVVPPQCPACHVRLRRGPAFCRECGRDAARRLRRPPRVWVHSGDHPVFPVLAVGPLAGAWGRAVRAYKADPAPGVAGVVLPPMLRVARCAREGLRIASGEPVTLVPVPMAAVRRRERGFNPAEELARALAAGTGWTSVPNGLERRQYRRPLRGLSAQRRREEVAGAFAAGPGVARLAGSRVVLVDDVVTTGATLRVAIEALRAAGMAPAGALALARTRRPGRSEGGRREGGPGEWECSAKS
jgi:predicted amidophosphoribosyltransferase